MSVCESAPCRVPWSAIPLGVLGLTAVAGFPLDEMWHASYGVDVTMWSPTHLIMILGASLSPLGAWLALAEAGVHARGGATKHERVAATVAHGLCAWMTLAGLSSALGEFEFGVPQFQQLYHPVLVALVGGFALTAARRVIGDIGTIAAAGLSMISRVSSQSFQDHGFVETRPGAMYVGCAIAVVIAARVVGTDRVLRYGVASGLGVGTLGLASEWWYNAGAHQPWTSALLPNGVLLPLVVAVAASVIGACFGAVAAGERVQVPRPVLAVAALVLIGGLILPLPRTAGDVDASVRLERHGDRAAVTVEVTPADAADGANWFQLIAWQGGGLVVTDLRETSPGLWVGEADVPVTGGWKTMLRLHRGSEMMAVPIWLPADAEIDAAEIPAVSRDAAFVSEQRYLFREAREGGMGFAAFAYTVIAAIALLWLWSLSKAATSVLLPPAPDPAGAGGVYRPRRPKAGAGRR